MITRWATRWPRRRWGDGRGPSQGVDWRVWGLDWCVSEAVSLPRPGPARPLVVYTPANYHHRLSIGSCGDWHDDKTRNCKSERCSVEMQLIVQRVHRPDNNSNRENSAIETVINCFESDADLCHFRYHYQPHQLFQLYRDHTQRVSLYIGL